MKNGFAAAAGMLAIGAVLVGARTAPAQDRGPRIVFVSLDRVFNEYYKTKLADTQLKTQAEEFNQERQKMIAEIQAMQNEFNTIREEAQNTALNDEIRAQKRTLAEEKLMAIREQESKIKRFDELRSKQLEDQTRRMRRGLVEEIREAIREYSRGQGFDAVIDASGQTLNGIESIIYFDDKLDITARVIEAINKGARGTAPAE